MIQMAIATIVSTGAASYISRCIGKKDNEEANRTLATGGMICIILAVIVMVVGMTVIEPLINGLGASKEVYPYAYDYVSIMLLGSIPVMLNYAGGQLLRSEGAMLYYLYYYLSGKALLKLNIRFISKKATIWKEIFIIGIPACMSQFLLSVAMIILNNLVGNNDVLKAGMGVSSKLMFIGTFIFMGFAAGCQPLVGYNYGAGNIPRVRSVIKTGMAMTSGIGITLMAIFWTFAPNMVGIFTPLEDVRDAGVQVFRISIFSFIVLGPQMLATTGIQAFGKAKEALILSVARQGLFYIPLLFFMKKLAGFEGLIWAQPISDVITLGLGIVFLAVILKQCIGNKEN